MKSTMHRVDFPYARQELEALGHLPHGDRSPQRKET